MSEKKPSFWEKLGFFRQNMKTLGRFLFRIRSFTPIPLIILLIIFAHPSQFSFSIGFIIVILGELLRIWAVGYAGAATRTRSMGAARQLVTAGPYAYVRNPLYLGNFLLSLGICIISGVHWMIPIFLVGYIFQYLPIIFSEEAHLRKECGKIYDDYYANVPRFIPRILYANPSLRSGPEHDFSLRRAIKSEKRTFMAIVLVIVLLLIRFHVLRR
ncbi:isoprenylcysteine carboxylmethyltransferase family protein [Candidatus Poribacteria bacterium]|nr:isoprenylcysteine carboxylmethyltransferase family protein [Candidatus Poribacteria bacterium]